MAAATGGATSKRTGYTRPPTGCGRCEGPDQPVKSLPRARRRGPAQIHGLGKQPWMRSECPAIFFGSFPGFSHSLTLGGDSANFLGVVDRWLSGFGGRLARCFRGLISVGGRSFGVSTLRHGLRPDPVFRVEPLSMATPSDGCRSGQGREPMVPLRRRLVLFLDNLVVVIGILKECRGNSVSTGFQGVLPRLATVRTRFGWCGGRTMSEKFRNFSRGLAGAIQSVRGRVADNRTSWMGPARLPAMIRDESENSRTNCLSERRRTRAASGFASTRFGWSS